MAETPSTSTLTLLPGTLDLLVLSVLMHMDNHAYALARAIESASGGGVKIEEGSLYPCLKRLQAAGCVQAAWALGPTGRRVRQYSITGPGRRAWATQHTLWLRFAAAVDSVVSTYT